MIQGDRGYDSERHGAELRQRGITRLIGYRYPLGHGSCLGRTRWGRQYIAVQSGCGFDALTTQSRLNVVAPGQYPEVAEGGAV